MGTRRSFLKGILAGGVLGQGFSLTLTHDLLAKPAGEPVRIGHQCDLTGGISSWGYWHDKAAKAAVDYLAAWGEGATPRDRLVAAMEAISAWENSLAATYYSQVKMTPGVTVWGPDFSTTRRAPTVSITIDGVDPVEAARRLGERGVFVWDGHFYAARAVEALGLSGRGGLLRAGMSMYTTREEVDRLLSGVAEIAAS